ncbi:hypothetical protein [Neptunomonas marina]|uniref:hypothetical protein n=1 Tax=Neptunomonas marina TaxID=1815562 RepID=UPI00198226E4|nr:hypothetical protein [Neptunomonas marina]
MNLKGVLALSIGALIAIATAVAHLSCIFLGPSCYQAQMAPPEIVQSATEGTLLAPMATLIISFLFLVCAVFAMSGAGFIKKLPFIEPVLATISGLSLLRGLATIPSSYAFPEMVSAFSITAGLIWFVAGLLYFYGFRSLRQPSS